MNAVTDEDSADYIPDESRIAVFGFDSTLFLETDPTHFDWMLFSHHVPEEVWKDGSAEFSRMNVGSRSWLRFQGS